MATRNVLGGRRMAALSWGAIAAALALAPAVASARPYRSQFELSRGLGDPADRLGVFVDWTQSSTEYNAKFDVETHLTGFASDFTYKANGMSTTTMVPRVGITWASSERLLLEASVGLSSYSFEERIVRVAGFENEQAVLGKDLNAGIALEAGALYTIGRLADFQGTLGARVAYRSSGKASGDDLRGTIRSGGSTTNVTYVEANDITVRTLAATLSLGAEWRPRNTWLVNDFGITGSYAYTIGSIKHRVSSADPSSTTTVTSNVDISMTPTNYVGLYYGWSLFWPRVGVFGLEGQFLADPRVTLTYEYIF